MLMKAEGNPVEELSTVLGGYEKKAAVSLNQYGDHCIMK